MRRFRGTAHRNHTDRGGHAWTSFFFARAQRHNATSAYRAQKGLPFFLKKKEWAFRIVFVGGGNGTPLDPARKGKKETLREKKGGRYAEGTQRKKGKKRDGPIAI